MKPENRKQLVRGYVVVGNRYCSCIQKDSPDCITAYTHWYRHDDNLGILERETNKILDLYMSFEKTDSALIGYEYKDYKKYT